MQLLISMLLAMCTFTGNVHGHCNAAQDACPRQCDCEYMFSGGIRIDCSGRRLWRTPQVLPNTTIELLLNRNDITATYPEDFQNCMLLKLLDLSNNELERLSDGSFSSATHIERLYLNDNNLKYDELPSGIFSKLESLRVFYLHNNNYKNITSYPEHMIDDLINLEVLTLDGFSGVRFRGEFSRLRSLKSLQVYGGIDVIRNETFDSFCNSSVTELSLKTKMSLKHLEPASFSHFRKLITLDLSYNQGLGFQSGVSSAWWGLQFTAIKKLNLTRIVSLDEQAARIDSEFFKDLELNKIETLSIDRNNIIELKAKLSVAFPHLVYLDISYNRVTEIANVLNDIMFLLHLTYLDFSHQSKRYVDDYGRSFKKRSISQETISSAGELRTADADDWFSKCQTPPMTPCSPWHSDIENKQYFLERSDLIRRSVMHDHGTWCIVSPPRLEMLILTQSLNVDLRTLPAIVLMRNRRFKRFVYRNNEIENLVMSLVLASPANISVDFGDNRIRCLSPDVFNFSLKLGSNVDELRLSGNNLAEQFEHDVNGITFQHLERMKLLDISRNGIKSLSQNVFSHTVLLETIDLSQNSLRTFGVRVRHLKMLTLLNISNNLLTTLDSNKTDELTEIFQSMTPNGNLSIDLTGNPLQCSCDTLPFLRWISFNRNHMNNFLNYACFFNQSYVTFSRLDNTILVELQYECSRRLAVVVSATLCALFLVLIAISVCMYRYRWEVRYWCLWLTQRSKLYRELRDDNDYDYNAFVSYSGFDGDWVRNQLVPHLEAGEPITVNERLSSVEDAPPELSEVVMFFRLCLHERDFLPGNDIAGNIWSKMDRSRKVILVISPSFARSNFCDFEMNLARKASFDRARNLFIPIILETTDVEDMSDGLRWIVRNLTYIEWPSGEYQGAERAEFWRAVRNALGEHGLSLNFQRQ